MVLSSSQGTHSGTTIPVSAPSSQPAVLQASVEQTPKVRTRRKRDVIKQNFIFQ